MITTEKADQTIHEWLQSMLDKFNRIRTSQVVWFLFLNGIWVSAATTGALADLDIDPKIIAGVFYFIAFIVVILALASRFNPTVKFFSKLFTAGVIGYSAFWQYGAWLFENQNFTPIFAVNKVFSMVFFSAACLGGLAFAFTGNNDDIDPERLGISYAELAEMRKAAEIVRMIPQDVINQYTGY